VTARPLLIALPVLALLSLSAAELHAQVPPAAPTTPTNPLVERAYKAAEEAYQRGQYKRVIELLRPLVVPKTRINSKPQLLSAYKLLAISYVFEKDIPAAESSFGAILAEDPKFTLDPAVDPAAAVRVFRAYKRRNAAMLAKIEQAQVEARKREIAAQKRREEELRQLRELAKRGSTVIERREIRRSYALNFVPFGAGQFQNGHRIKGWLLLISQVALAATSIGAHVGYRLAYPRPVDLENTSVPNALITTQLTSAGLFAALAVYGVIDALIYFRPISTTERRRTRKLGLSITPSLGAGSAGMGVSVTF
jgi:tetratricopeptide (TPR) repeat protein